jgi:arylsulfatase A-like enzyme
MNVLMIAIDDLRPESSAYGHTHMHTPNMQALAERSMLFTRAYVQVALCMPSRNALLFSRRPDTAQAWEIASTQFPRSCGGASCAGNECGPKCGIIDHLSGKLAVTLPGWFYNNGFFTVGAGKIFHEGSFTENQDYEHSWTPSTTNPHTGLYDPPMTQEAMYNGKSATPTWYAFDVEDEAMSETEIALRTVRTQAYPARAPFFLRVNTEREKRV